MQVMGTGSTVVWKFSVLRNKRSTDYTEITECATKEVWHKVLVTQHLYRTCLRDSYETPTTRVCKSLSISVLYNKKHPSVQSAKSVLFSLSPP